jgi:hypothetical protein
MKQLKRLLMLLGFLPTFIISVLLWIFTGKDPLELIEKLIDWGTK